MVLPGATYDLAWRREGSTVMRAGFGARGGWMVIGGDGRQESKQEESKREVRTKQKDDYSSPEAARTAA